MRRSVFLFGSITVLVIAGITLLASVAFSGDNPEKSRLELMNKPPGAIEKIDASVSADGETYSLGSYDNGTGLKCIVNRTSGDGPTTSCFDPQTTFNNGREIYVAVSARQKSGSTPLLDWNKVWISGVVSPRVSRLDLVDLDCSVTPLALDEDRTFFEVVAKSDIARGTLPYKLVAHAPDDSVIDTQDVRVGLPSNAKKAGLKAPQPSAAC
jgi:hypothetical protein